jgi:hypothetical protein
MTAALVHKVTHHVHTLDWQLTRGMAAAPLTGCSAESGLLSGVVTLDPDARLLPAPETATLGDSALA